MTQDQAIAAAKKEAAKNGCDIIVVNAPIENAEDASGPYGFCPEPGIGLLFRFGTAEKRVSPNGTVRPF